MDKKLISERGLRTIILEGSPYDMGFAHGDYFRDDLKIIRDAFKSYLSRVGGRIVPGGLLATAMGFLARRYVKYIPGEYMEEMRGVSEGAKVGLRFILLINVLDDLAVSLGCSGFAVFSRLSKGAGLIMGRNLDYPVFIDLMCRMNTVFICRPKKGFPFMSFAWPGYIGSVTAMNSKGVSLFSFSSPSKERKRSGFPTGLLYRWGLQYSDTLTGLFDKIAKAQRTIGNNLIIGSPEKGGKALAMEVTRARWKIRWTENGCITMTNHFKTDEMRPFAKGFISKPPAVNVPDRYFTMEYSILRDDLIRNECRKGSVDVERAVEILKTPEVSNPGTVQSVIFVPERLEAWAARNDSAPVSHGEYRRITI